MNLPIEISFQVFLSNDNDLHTILSLLVVFTAYLLFFFYAKSILQSLSPVTYSAKMYPHHHFKHAQLR